MLVYILLGMIAALIVLLIWVLIRQPVNQVLVEQNRELLNRLMAPDVKTFQVLQTSSAIPDPDQKYYPRDDETEAEQLVQLGGIGTPLSPDDIRAYNREGFGINFNEFDLK